MRGIRDRLDGKPLPSVILYATKNDKGDRRTLLSDRIEYIRLAKGELAVAGEHLDNRLSRVISVQAGLRGECVLRKRPGAVNYLYRSKTTCTHLIRGKGFAFAENLEASGGGFVER